MKKIICFFIIIFSTSSFSQFNEYPRPGQGELSGGLGLSWIDGEPFYTFNFTPEISFANLGVGLNLRLEFNSEGKLRNENFNEFSDYLSIVRYVRYGLKNDPLFIKLGAIDYYTLGHGSIMYLYNNSPGFDVRKTGLVFDIDFGTLGFESIYGQFAEAGVFGLRGYVRPLQFTSLGAVPVIGNVEFGASYAADYHEKAGIISGIYNRANDEFQTGTDAGAINIIGFDIGFPIVSTRLLDVELYTDYTKIIDFGSGIAAGVIVNVGGLGLVTASAKLERRFNNNQYIPAYFNSFYEVERFRIGGSSSNLQTPQTKVQALALANGDDGYFGALGVNVLGMFNILGSYQRLDKTPESGILHLGAEIAPEDLPFIARAGYDKINIGNETAILKVDNNSYLFTEVGYKPVPFLIVSLVYHWTFTPVRDADDNIIDYLPQKRIEPRVSFVVPFGFE